jgi:putative flippase GtrA
MVTVAYGGPMRLVRWKGLLHEVSKFGTIGAVNTVINYAVFNLLVLTAFANGQLKANVVATMVATTSSYFMNRHWTYSDRPKSALHREYALFFLFNAAGMAIELGVLAIAKYGLGIHGLIALNVAKAVATALGMVFRFWTYRTLVFKKAPTPVPVSPAPATSEFDQLTGPLEVELDPPLDPGLRAELDKSPARPWS